MNKRVDINKDQFKSIVFSKQCPVCDIENPGSQLNQKKPVSA